MKIAVVGAGFTGLTAAFRLSQKKHKVTLFEKEVRLGGLASSFHPNGWDWPLERHYHHWFTNDTHAIGLIKELGLESFLLFPKTLTSIYYQDKMYPFNSPQNVFNFSPLSILDRLRTGFVTLYLKLLPLNLALKLEKQAAHIWLCHWYGKKAYEILWYPLLTGKFGPFAKNVNMAWFWARIYKRTPRLGYLVGGYGNLVKVLAKTIEREGGKIVTNTAVNQKTLASFDKVIVTTPSFIFTKLFPNLPLHYKQRLTATAHLHALNLVLITKEKILEDIYWLNINDRSFPFLAVVAQTNLIDEKHYGGHHVTWVGNYLPPDHPFLKMSKDQLLKKFLPYLLKINPHVSQFSIVNCQLFYGPFAQPVFPINYSKIKPDFVTPLQNVFLANMDMVYPWDRGTNYAIELGNKVAEIVEKDKR